MVAEILCIDCSDFERNEDNDAVGHCKIDGEFRFFYWGCQEDDIKKKKQKRSKKR